MEKTLIFASASEVRFEKVFRFIVPTYLTSLFNTLYTMVDGVFVSSYVGTNALASINIVYPIVNVLTGIALVFATGGSAIAALMIGAQKKPEANRAFSVSVLFSLLAGSLISLLVGCNLTETLRLLGATRLTMADCKIYIFWWLLGTPLVIGKELATYFIRVDGTPSYSFLSALAGGICNIALDYVLVAKLQMGIRGAALATFFGLLVSAGMGVFYFAAKRNILRFTIHGLTFSLGVRCMCNGLSEFVDQLAIAITTVVFNQTVMSFAGEDGIASVSIIMYLQFVVIGIYFGFSMGIAPPLGYAYGEGKRDVCRILESYAFRFLGIAPIVLYGLTYILAPIGVSFFAEPSSAVYPMAVAGMRWYGLGFTFCGINIFCAVRFMAYGKGYLSGVITFLRSFALLIIFLTLLPRVFALNGIWLAMPFSECLTMLVSIGIMIADGKPFPSPTE